MYTYIFISLYTCNFAISLIRNIHNIISLGPEYIRIYYCIIYSVYLVCTYLFVIMFKKL